MGSQNWCIVYSPDTYGERYFGKSTFNTQYIIFNFNLPASSSNSMFGLTLDVDGEIKHGGSQNKLNQSVSLENIKELTGIPDDVLVPNPKYVKIKNMIEMIHGIFVKKDSDFRHLSYFIKKNIKEGDESIKDYVIDIIQYFNSSSRFDISRHIKDVINKTFGDKTIEETKEILKDEVIETFLFNLDFQKVMFSILSIESKETLHFLFMKLIIKNIYDRFVKEESIVKKTKILTPFIEHGISYIKNHIIKTIENFDINETESKKIFDKIEEKNNYNWNEFWKEYNDVFETFKSTLIYNVIELDSDIDFEFKNFNEYKQIYDKYNEVDGSYEYEYLFDNSIYTILAWKFKDDKDFSKFLIDNINKNDELSAQTILNEIALESKDYLEHSTFEQFDDEEFVDFYIGVVNEIEDTDEIKKLVRSSSIIGTVIFRELKKYGKEYKESINIETTEDGIDYVSVSDFDQFDDLIFENDYFSNMDDYVRMD
ncbi:MAG: hypothetical protein ACOC3V_05630 [bacterium]